MPRAAPATLKAADFLILEALNRKPMNTRELSRALQISTSAVRDRIKRFQDVGLVLKQHPDRKWALKLIVRVETPRETAELLGAEIPNLPPKQRDLPDPKVIDRATWKKAREGPQEVAEEVLPPTPDLTIAPPPEKPYKPIQTAVEVSEKARKISERFKVPVHLVQLGRGGDGEVAMGKMGTCTKCGKGTPFRYGEKHLCPTCARANGGR